jgi:hypothetical protein
MFTGRKENILDKRKGQRSIVCSGSTPGTPGVGAAAGEAAGADKCLPLKELLLTILEGSSFVLPWVRAGHIVGTTSIVLVSEHEHMGVCTHTRIYLLWSDVPDFEDDL